MQKNRIALVHISYPWKTQCSYSQTIITRNRFSSSSINSSHPLNIFNKCTVEALIIDIRRIFAKLYRWLYSQLTYHKANPSKSHRILLKTWQYHTSDSKMRWTSNNMMLDSQYQWEPLNYHKYFVKEFQLIVMSSMLSIVHVYFNLS